MQLCSMRSRRLPRLLLTESLARHAKFFNAMTLTRASSLVAGPLPVPMAKTLGHVISVRGSQASVGLPKESQATSEEPLATVGKFLGVRSGSSLLIGLISDVSLRSDPTLRENGYFAQAQLDLIGEIHNHATPSAKFARGVSTYPPIGAAVVTIGSEDFALIFRTDCSRIIEVGKLQQDATTAACVEVDEMLSKHFAVLGTTGVGKSSAVTLLLRQILAARPDLRVFLLDVHNEYGRCFGEQALVLNPNNIKLPFWLCNFDEFVDVLFGGRPSVDDEVDILSECIPLAKLTYAQYAASHGRISIRASENTTRYTVDVPVPYRISDLIELLDARMGKLENRSMRMLYHKLISRIEAVCNDPRYAFMFENANVGGDTMLEILSKLFRLPIEGVPITVLQLAGFPSEMVDAVVSVTCRMAFDLGLWTDGANPLLVLCEEAHRYMAADHKIGFAPTRRAISRIAKEGRKYGVFLGLVSQRPAELEPTILSQCSTLFAMRMTNDRDQALLRSAVADTAANFLAFLPSLGTGEAFAFGEGVALPMRLKFRQLPTQLLPKSETGSPDENGAATGQHTLSAALERWRGGTTRHRGTLERATLERTTGEAMSTTVTPQSDNPVHAQAIEPNPLKLLKRPLDPPDTSPAQNKANVSGKAG
jgi:DNA helicase HerA-like ATPase